MAATAFDTLDAARKLKAAGIESEHAEAIVGVMGRSVSQLVTVEHFDAQIAKLHADNTELRARTDAGYTELRARTDAGYSELRTHIDARTAKLQGGITDLHARIDTVKADMRSDKAELNAAIVRWHLISVGVMIAAIGLATTILGMFMNRGGGV